MCRPRCTLACETYQGSRSCPVLKASVANATAAYGTALRSGPRIMLKRSLDVHRRSVELPGTAGGALYAGPAPFRGRQRTRCAAAAAPSRARRSRSPVRLPVPLNDDGLVLDSDAFNSQVPLPSHSLTACPWCLDHHELPDHDELPGHGRVVSQLQCLTAGATCRSCPASEQQVTERRAVGTVSMSNVASWHLQEWMGAPSTAAGAEGPTSLAELQPEASAWDSLDGWASAGGAASSLEADAAASTSAAGSLQASLASVEVPPSDIAAGLTALPDEDSVEAGARGALSQLVRRLTPQWLSPRVRGLVLLWALVALVATNW